MSALYGPAKIFTGPELDVLETLGHGDRLLVVDTSYRTRTLTHVKEVVELSRPLFVAQAVLHIAQLHPIENNLVVCMARDPSDERDIAKNAKQKFDHFLGGTIINADGNVVNLTFEHVPRNDEDSETGKGFYTIANDPDESTIIFRVPSDFDPYACMTFTAADSQTGNPASYNL